MSQTVSKSWAEIIKDAEAKNTSGYKLLDTKMLFTTDGHALCFELAGMNVDTLADGSGKAGMTWISRTIGEKIMWNATNSNTGGYPESGYKQYLENTCLNQIPLNIKNAMKTVTKYCISYNPKNSDLSYTAKIWPPNAYELNAKTDPQYGTTGAKYTAYTESSQRIRYDALGKPAAYWLSSTIYNDDARICIVSASGYITFAPALGPYAYGVLPCFCL